MEIKPKNKLVEIEEKILVFWTKEKIFQKSIEKPAPKGDFVFYDGPPFATGSPHFGHILPTTIKDAIPRYKTMRGYRVRRRWGWDCHGLPVENLIEKELDLKTKKDIENYGIEKFNQKAKESVLRYADEWRKIIPRIGRWVDMDNDYRTMDASYTESVWWAFKKLHEKNLIYEGYKSMQICPRCETTLSNFEVGQGYKDVTDISVYVKFELIDEPNTYLLAWTTTPWTLPGNAALAVGVNINYAKVKFENSVYILAEERISEIFAAKSYEIIGRITGNDLVGKEYEPIFDYYDNDALKNRKNAWKVYAADFVTTDEGAGIVHIAPAFGEEDMNIGKKYNLPFIQHVAMNGVFKKEVKDFSGLHAKPKDDPQTTDIEIIKFLAGNNTLFSKKKIIHPYPHCWRCETPLLNYAASSWFVSVLKIKDKLINQNSKISWIPKEIGQNRFGDWLKGARDWAISRSRFWGAPIPVWRCKECQKIKVIGSLSDILKNSKPRNRFILMRHGEAENNARNILDGVNTHKCHLTQKGLEQVRLAAEKLRTEKIDFIVSSPFIRTQETAHKVAAIIGLSKDKVIVDNRLHELNAGIFDGRSISEFHSYEDSHDMFDDPPEGGESYLEIASRMLSAVIDINKNNENKTILLVTHHAPAWLLTGVARALSRKKTNELWKDNGFLNNADFVPLDYIDLPRNKKHEIDFHRPYIDHIELDCLCGAKMKRVPEVFDCWFESGSMPYAEAHYPFDKKDFFPRNFFKSKGFPADFIAEGLDQTRGWFYSMLVLGVSLFGRAPYRNVIVNGLILAEDGEKMSKSKGNFPQLLPTIEKYGADALRFFLASSPAAHSEDVRFSEQSIDEISKKLLQRLDNVLTFFETYSKKEVARGKERVSSNILDRWIVARLEETTKTVTEGLEDYELDRVARQIFDFVDDLSNWYIRRSRERFKNDDKEALSTTKYVLLELSKLMAPFTPFYAEYLYGKVSNNEKESVHLESWPEVGHFNRKIIADMQETRRLVSFGLEARAKAGIKVRQPLKSAKLKAQNEELGEEFLELIKQELNVKTVEYARIENEIEIDTTMTEELRQEGIVREFVRAAQELRKANKFSVEDEAVLIIDSDEKGKELAAKIGKELKKVANVRDVIYESLGNIPPLTIEEYSFKLKIVKNKS